MPAHGCCPCLATARIHALAAHASPASGIATSLHEHATIRPTDAPTAHVVSSPALTDTIRCHGQAASAGTPGPYWVGAPAPCGSVARNAPAPATDLQHPVPGDHQLRIGQVKDLRPRASAGTASSARAASRPPHATGRCSMMWSGSATRSRFAPRALLATGPAARRAALRARRGLAQWTVRRRRLRRVRGVLGTASLQLGVLRAQLGVLAPELGHAPLQIGDHAHAVVVRRLTLRESHGQTNEEITHGSRTDLNSPVAQKICARTHSASVCPVVPGRCYRSPAWSRAWPSTGTVDGHALVNDPDQVVDPGSAMRAARSAMRRSWSGGLSLRL